jgi:hypothetical protein
LTAWPAGLPVAASGYAPRYAPPRRLRQAVAGDLGASRPPIKRLSCRTDGVLDAKISEQTRRVGKIETQDGYRQGQGRAGGVGGAG